MAKGRVHIVGAGLAGLAAAVELRDCAEVVLHEASAHAGGRCRSFHDDAIGATIDNGNHLVLSGNAAAMKFAKTVGAVGLQISHRAEFPFLDLKTGRDWTIDAGAGASPFWIFSKRRRALDTSSLDHLELIRLLLAREDAPLESILTCSGPLYDHFLRPILVAALNTDPKISSARLARAIAWESLARGGRACRPVIAKDGLSSAFVDPAIKLLQAEDVLIKFNHRLRRLITAESRIGALDFGDEMILLGPHDRAILAVPGMVAADLLPGLSAPIKYNAIVNAHFAIDPPKSFPNLMGVIGGTTEWIFSFPGRLATTTSDANALLEVPREELANRIWSEVARATGLPTNLPRWQIIKEKRATFSATPEENAKRPSAKTRWSNLFLAGDWTATGLPSTIEGAIRSGSTAARLVRALSEV